MEYPVNPNDGQGSVLLSAPLRRLAIVGSHPKTRELAPYNDDRYEIWLFNESPMKPETYPRWDSSLQIHKPEVYTSLTNWVNKDYWAWLQQDHGKDKRIFMQEKDPHVPNAVRYPIEGVFALLPKEYRYLRSSPAIALALAIYLGYKDIALYGSELTSNTEYQFQATNYAFWIGFAHGRGVNLDLECWQDEFYNQPLYGYEGEYQIDKEFYINKFHEYEKAVKSNEFTYKKARDRIEKAMEDKDYKSVGDLIFSITEVARAVGETRGARDEALRYSERTDMISRQEFEKKSAQAQIDATESENNMYYSGGKCEYVWNVWKQTGRYEALAQLREFIEEKCNHAIDFGRHFGIAHENMMFMVQYDKGITALGGERARAQILGKQ